MARNTLAVYGLVSVILFIWAVGTAYAQFDNYYAAAVHLNRSQFSKLVVMNMLGFLFLGSGKILQLIFFGNLRTIELERLQERIWYAFTETLLALTIFRTEINLMFMGLFAILMLMKVFHWVLQDRIEFMDVQESPILFHIRVIGLLVTLWILDSSFCYYSILSIVAKKSVMVMFASEYTVLLIQVLSMTLRYALNIFESFIPARQQPWANKSLYVFYIELFVDFLRLVSFIVFFVTTLIYFSLPLNMLRDVYMTLRSFILKCSDLVRLKKATRNMDEKYPSATREELEQMSDRTCIICREELEFIETASSPDTRDDPVHDVLLPQVPKRLACGHVFHFQCLRSWLERQQSCPTCRRSVLDVTETSSSTSDTPENGANGRDANQQQRNINHAIAQHLESIRNNHNNPNNNPNNNSDNPNTNTNHLNNHNQHNHNHHNNIHENREQSNQTQDRPSLSREEVQNIPLSWFTNPQPETRGNPLVAFSLFREENSLISEPTSLYPEPHEMSNTIHRLEDRVLSLENKLESLLSGLDTDQSVAEGSSTINVPHDEDLRHMYS